MRKVTKALALKSLDEDWSGYVEQLSRLSSVEKRKFLQEQGFQTAADLLVHIAAWWKECMKQVVLLRKDPAYRPPKIDVDAFNRKAVEENKKNSEERTMEIFLRMQSEITSLVKALPPSAFENKSINDFLYWCVTNHLREHSLHD